jgi:alkylation response protein AidB-like acyl-CoA dehydrogenase
MTQPHVPRAYDRLWADVQRGLWQGVAALVPEIEASEHIPLERLFPILREMGAFGLLIAPEHGGSGLTITQYAPIIGEFAKVHGGVRALIHVHNSFAHAFQSAATPEQRSSILPAAARGEGSIAFALTEPSGGTGADLHTRAERDRTDWVIEGEKWLITNSAFASHFMVFAKSPEGRGTNSVTAFVVARETAGLHIEPLMETMGSKGGSHGRLRFDRVRVTADDVLGAVGDGLRLMEAALEASRVLVAASSLGAATYALELSVEYSKQRVTFGRPIGERQAVQRYLAEMAIDVYALERMVADAAGKLDAGRRIPREAAMCKLFGAEAAARVTDRALLVFGGIGYTRQHPIERLYRDARLNLLEEGTPTIQQLLIARDLLS